MPTSFYYQSFNVGVVDVDKLHRVDLERMRLAAEDQTNLLPDAIGKAILRPGFEHLKETHNGAKARIIDFDAGGPRVYGLELTPSFMKVWDGDAPVSRPAVATVIADGTFATGTGWTFGADAGTTSLVTGGALKLQAFGRGARAYARQQVTVAVGDVGKEHGLRVTVFRGPARFRIGTTAGGQEVVKETVLRTGYHSLAFIATGNFWVEFSTETLAPVYVNDIQVEAAGDMVLPTVWAEDDLQYIRHDQSLDVMFLACEGRKPQRIESRGSDSWSVCDYDSDDGPFIVGRTAEVRIKPTVLEGSGLLQSDLPFFSADHVGALFRIYHDGQRVDTFLAKDGEFSPPIMVTGINEPDYNERAFTWTVSGTFVGTLRFQRSFDGEDVEFHRFRKAQAVATTDITAPESGTNDDNEDNAIAYYKLGFEDGTYTSGAARVQITYQGGGGFGIARVVSYNSPTEVVMEVLKPFMNTTFTEDWREGAWSESVGWPTCVAIDDGRLSWAGYDQFWGSVSDAFDSFNEDLVGDAGPLLRAIALGGRNEARWMVSLSTLMIGVGRGVAAVRASSLDEIKTPENFGIRRTGGGRVGAARVNPALLADDRALFVEAAGTAVYELNYDATKGKFLATEFSKLTTKLFRSGVSGMTVQNRPDQRIWITTNSGDAVCVVFEPAQQVVAFIPITTGNETDIIESLTVLPADNGQDRVLASIKRTVNGVVSRRVERLALDVEAIPAAITKCLDAHKVFGSGSATVDLPHLVGKTVWAWVDGQYVEDADGVPVPFVVSGAGTITLPDVPVTGGCAGIPYAGRYKSARLEYAATPSTSMLQNKTVSKVGILLGDYCRSGIRYGTEFDNPDHPLFSLPLEKNGMPTPDIILGPDTPEPMNSVEGPILLDARVCIEVTKPATLLALVLEFEGHGG